MRLRLFILFFLCITSAFCSFGQGNSEKLQSRILILLDESSSMLQPWSGGKEKHLIANQLVLKLIDSVYSVNRDVEFSLRVFGSQYGVLEHNCTDTKNEVPFSKYNKTQMEFRLEDIQPYGGTCIAYSLSEAADKDLVDEDHIAYSIVLITDGGESCDGDICAVMTRLLKKKIYFKPYILSLEDVAGLKDEYACLGNYLPITKKGDIGKAVGTIVESFRPMLTISKEEYKTLQTAVIPSVLKMNSSKVTVEKKDSVAVVKPKPKPVEPEVKPKPVDTVEVVKKAEPPKSKIVVGEEVKKPEPVKMKRVAYSKPTKLFVGVSTKFRPTDIEAGAPEIKLPEPPPALPAPTKMATLKPTAIKKFKIAKPEPYTPVDVVVGLPVIKEPEIVVEKPVAVKMAKIAPARMKKLATAKVPAFTPGDIAITGPVLNIKEPEVIPVAPTPVKMAIAKATKIKKLPTEKVGAFLPQNVFVAVPDIKVKLDPPPVVVPEVTVEKIKMAKLKPTKISKWHLLYGGEFFDEKLKLIKLPPEPTFKPIATTVTPVKPATPEVKKINPAVNTGEYSVTQEDAKETSMAVYLSDGKGKYYSVTPKVVLTDAATNKPIKTFTRFVDANGQPDPIKNIATGKYYLTVEGRDDLIASVDLLPNKRTRVEIIVKKFSLYFYYEGGHGREVKEFNARVIQRNVPNGRVIEQKCTEKLEYEPGNYHININTFPEEVRNIDLESNSAGGIGIKQPGFVKFTVEGKATSLTLHKQQGDRYVQFYTLNLSDPASQHMQIQPGKYQVQYNNGTTKFSSTVKVLEFFVKSNEETEVILK